MILVTGATGHLGKGIIDILLQSLPADGIAALVRDESKAAGLREKGVDVRVGDYNDVESMVRAFAGVDKLMLISSSDMADRVTQHINAIHAAREAGVGHITYTGIEMKDPSNSAIAFIAASHIAAYEHLKASGIPYTIFRNTLYAEVLPMFIGERATENGIFFPAGDGRVPYATRSDMAEASAQVLMGGGHENKEYALSVNHSYSFADIAAILSEIAGREVAYINPPMEIFVEQLVKAGVPEMYADFSASFGEAIKNNEFDLPGTTLEELLGRKPTSLKEYLQSVYAPGK